MVNLTKTQKYIGVFFIAVTLLVLVQCFTPKTSAWHFGKADAPTTSIITVKRGESNQEIASQLTNAGIISHGFSFRLSALLSFSYHKLQAGRYEVSSALSPMEIVQKMAAGQTVKTTITIPEGWDIQDIAEYLADKKILSQEDFIKATNANYEGFDFLADKPKKLGLEGYLFPDTYEMPESGEATDLARVMLSNFDKKLTPDLRQEITRQKKSIFKIITMASILEKEVKTLEDKKMVAGILWKRIAEGMPLQVDATVNYITRKDHPGALLADTKIDSPYNTYKYYGLPLGPISNPGIDSIIAAIYPTKSPYWYYLSSQKTGKTIFSKTLDEHNLAAAKYLK